MSGSKIKQLGFRPLVWGEAEVKGRAHRYQIRQKSRKHR